MDDIVKYKWPIGKPQESRVYVDIHEWKWVKPSGSNIFDPSNINDWSVAVKLIEVVDLSKIKTETTTQDGKTIVTQTGVTGNETVTTTFDPPKKENQPGAQEFPWWAVVAVVGVVITVALIWYFFLRKPAASAGQAPAPAPAPALPAGGAA